MIKAILFDYDGVLTTGVDVAQPSQKLAKNIGVTVELATQWMMAIWADFSTGAITEDQVWEQIEESYGKAIDQSARDIWFNWHELTPLPKMIQLVREVKAKGIKVGVLSNVFLNAKETIEANGGYDEFDLSILSCDVGYRKPDPQIFEYSLKQLGSLQPKEVLFLDDREPAITVASGLGFQTILVSDHDEAIAKVNALI